VDKIRKFGRWVWYNKERMVLVTVFVILLYRVYVVMYPPPPPVDKVLRPPDANIDLASLPPEAVPPQPGPKPPGPPPGNYTDLYKRNPFKYDTSGTDYGDERDRKDVTPADLGLELLAIREVNGRWRVQLNTRSVKRRWYDDGEQFEEYEVVQISPEDKSAVIYATKYNKRFTLTLKQ